MLLLSRNPTKKRFALAPFALTFLIMFFFWVLFSGKFDPFHISLGVGSSLIVAALSKDLLFPSRIKPGFIICWLRFVGYIPWFFYQIFQANLYVLYLVFHPRMMELIDPKIIEFDSRLINDISHYLCQFHHAYPRNDYSQCQCTRQIYGPLY